MDRFWLLTWTTYGTWLPGDERGFVGPIEDESGQTVIHNVPQTPYDADLPKLKQYALESLKGPPILLVLEQAEALLEQLRETAAHRGWEILAVAVLRTHVHIVLGIPGDPELETLLRDCKAYGSRKLNRGWKRPASGTWWTESGSKRKLKGKPAIEAAVRYVVNQNNPLLVWSPGERGA
ncbi:MAG: transposase [Planctomycetaceae bacterium]